MNASTHSLSTDTALRVLADRRRRQLLRYLAESDSTATLDHLVTALDEPTGGATAPDATREQLGAELQHVHLPMLQDAGLVEYDARTDTIRYHPTDLVEDLLQVCSST